MTDRPHRIQLLTEWSTNDAQLGETLKLIAAEPEWSPLRHEMEAGLHMMQARFAWRRADQLREQEADSARRRGRAAARADDGRVVVRHGICQMCAARVRLRVDGTIRVHDVGSGAAQSRAIAGAANRCAGAGLAPRPWSDGA